jgi:hypothetical protein
LLDGLHVFEQLVFDESLVALRVVVVAAVFLVAVEQLAQLAELALLGALVHQDSQDLLQ